MISPLLFYHPLYFHGNESNEQTKASCYTQGETGSWKWAGFAAGYTTLLAWVVSALVFQIGSLFL